MLSVELGFLVPGYQGMSPDWTGTPEKRNVNQMRECWLTPLSADFTQICIYKGNFIYHKRTSVNVIQTFIEYVNSTAGVILL